MIYFDFHAKMEVFSKLLFGVQSTNENLTTKLIELTNQHVTIGMKPASLMTSKG